MNNQNTEKNHSGNIDLLEMQFRLSPDTIFFVDRELRIVKINHVSSTSPYPAESVIGMDAAEILPSSVVEVVRREMNESISSGKDCEIDHQIWENMWVHKRMVPIKINEVVKYLLIISTDITEKKLAENAMKESEEKFNKAFFSNSAAMTIARIEDGVLFEVNNEALRLMERSRDEVIGKTVDDLKIWANPDDRTRVIKDLSEKKSVNKIEIKMRSKTGRIMTMLYSAEVTVIGGKDCIVASAYDITDRKRAEDFVRSIAYASPNLIYIYDIKNKKNVYANRLVLEFLGYTPDQIEKIGTNLFASVLHPDDAESVVRHHARFLNASETDIFEHEYRMKNAQGFWRWLKSRDILFARDDDGAALQILGVAEDITERKKVEEILKRDKESLEQSVIERTKELMDASEELERAKRLTDIGTLAATVAHELRNPLASINMAVANIKRKLKDPQFESHLQIIEKKVSESDQIINNLLFYSRFTMPEYEDINICNVLMECVGVTHERFANKNLLLRINCDPIRDIIFKADPLQMRELFNNLLSNAFDAVPAIHGKIEIKAFVREGKAEVSICDNGNGIKKEYIDRVFDPFFTTKAKGTGLGLAVSKQIVAVHKGDIKIESEENKGTTVTVILPLKESITSDRPLQAAGKL
jgi:PAS domain S-box-containing protein